MARNFTVAGSQFLQVEAAPITTTPYTMFAWGLSNNASTIIRTIWFGNGSVTNEQTALFTSGSSSDNSTRLLDLYTVNGLAITTTGPTTDQWHTTTGVSTSSTSRDAYIDGGSKGSNTTSVTIVNVNRTAIGAFRDSSPGYSDGDVSMGALWNVTLRETEDIEPMSRGVNPFVVQHDNLKFYAPLWANDGSVEPEYIAQNNLAVTGATRAATNPPVELLENYL